MVKDTRWLVQQGGHPTWHCVKDVPMKLRAVVGKPRLVKSLGTHDLVMARSLRWAVLNDFEAILIAARGQTGPTRAVEAGMAWRATLGRIASGDPASIAVHSARLAEPGTRPADVARSNAEEDISFQAEDFHEGDRATFLGVAYGHATPLEHHLEAWLAEGGPKGRLNPRTASQYRADVKRLGVWAKSARVPETVEAFTKAVAGRYVTETMVRPAVNATTGNRWISAASAYWRWMEKRAGLEGNPWHGQSLAKPAARSMGGERTKRPITDAELVKLLEGAPGPELADLIRVAALTGMRLGEIYHLTVADCTDGWFTVRVSKTAAGVRRVPIHSDLGDIVARRTQGKAAGAFLFHEARTPKEGRERSMPVSKRFGRYRQLQGVHDAKAGRRASAVDFHSLRRWFITAARQHFDQPTVAAVVGHEAGNITDDVYSGGPSDDRRRGVVECVRLPLPPPSSSVPSSIPPIE